MKISSMLSKESSPDPIERDNSSDVEILSSPQYINFSQLDSDQAKVENQKGLNTALDDQNLKQANYSFKLSLCRSKSENSLAYTTQLPMIMNQPCTPRGSKTRQLVFRESPITPPPTSLKDYYEPGKDLPSPNLKDLSMAYGFQKSDSDDPSSPTMSAPALVKMREEVRSRLQIQKEKEKTSPEKALKSKEKGIAKLPVPSKKAKTNKETSPLSTVFLNKKDHSVESANSAAGKTAVEPLPQDLAIVCRKLSTKSAGFGYKRNKQSLRIMTDMLRKSPPLEEDYKKSPRKSWSQPGNIPADSKNTNCANFSLPPDIVKILNEIKNTNSAQGSSTQIPAKSVPIFDHGSVQSSLKVPNVQSKKTPTGNSGAIASNTKSVQLISKCSAKGASSARMKSPPSSVFVSTKPAAKPGLMPVMTLGYRVSKPVSQPARTMSKFQMPVSTSHTIGTNTPTVSQFQIPVSVSRTGGTNTPTTNQFPLVIYNNGTNPSKRLPASVPNRVQPFDFANAQQELKIANIKANTYSLGFLRAHNATQKYADGIAKAVESLHKQVASVLETIEHINQDHTALMADLQKRERFHNFVAAWGKTHMNQYQSANLNTNPNVVSSQYSNTNSNIVPSKYPNTNSNIVPLQYGNGCATSSQPYVQYQASQNRGGCSTPSQPYTN